MRLFISFTFAFIILFNGTAYSAEIYRSWTNPERLLISGDIEKGDAQKFKNILQEIKVVFLIYDT